jgi:hypothetical protein
MAEVAGKVSKVYVIAGNSAMTGSTGTELKMDSNGLTQMAEMLDITSFGDNFKKRMPGIKDTGIEASGNYDPADAGQAILQTAYDNGTTVFVGIYPQGTGVAGKQVQCYVESIDIKATATGKQTFAPKFAPIAAPVALPLRP